MSYAEQQRQWLKDHNVNIGTRLRIEAGFLPREEVGNLDLCDGLRLHWAQEMCDEVGQIGMVTDIDSHCIQIETDTGTWWYPYFVLGVVGDPELEASIGAFLKETQ